MLLLYVHLYIHHISTYLPTVHINPCIHTDTDAYMHAHTFTFSFLHIYCTFMTGNAWILGDSFAYSHSTLEMRKQSLCLIIFFPPRHSWKTYFNALRTLEPNIHIILYIPHFIKGIWKLTQCWILLSGHTALNKTKQPFLAGLYV